MTTTVSEGGNFVLSTAKKSAFASAAMNLVDEIGSLFSLAFAVAEAIDCGLMSMPMLLLNREESVTVKKPDPQYASIKLLMLGLDGLFGLRMLSRMY